MSALLTKEIPAGPKPHWLVGNLPELRRGRLAFFERLARDYGDFAPFQAASRQVVLLSHPDMIEDMLVTQNEHMRKPPVLAGNKLVFGKGLLTSEGEFWRRQRRLAQPAFHRQRVAGYGQVMASYAARMAEGWRDGEVRDVHAEMMRVTLEIVAKTLFDADVQDQAPEVGDALRVLMEVFIARANRPFRIPDSWPTPANVKQRGAVERLDRIIYGIIEQRRSDPSDRGDLLSMLLAAQDDDGSRMTDKQLRDECMTLFLAGHETTAISLSWTLYLLSQNLDAEQRLTEELRSVLNGRTPAVDDLPQMPYTQAVVSESMRLYPPAWAIGREATADCEIGGYAVPARTILFGSQWVVHRDGRWFEQPLVFRPERWLGGDLLRRLPKYAYFPFGGGQRLCIGNTFATMEAQLILATIAQRWRMELLPGQRIEPYPSITLRPKYGVKMRLHRG